MKYTLFKPNAKNTGSLFDFEVGNNKNGSPALFVSMVLQSGWNDQTKTGSFKDNAKNPQKSSKIKFNATEAGEMISSIKTRVPCVFFHKSATDTTIIKFSPWDKDRKIKEQDGEKTYKSAAFALSVSKNSSQQFKIALEAGETEVLSLLLQDFINESLYQAKEASRKEFVENKNSNSQAPESKPQSKKQEDVGGYEEDEDSIPF